MEIIKDTNAKVYNWLFIAILFCTFYTAPLFSYCPIRFSDVGCFVLLYLSLKTNLKISSNSNNRAAILFIIWCIFDGLILSQFEFFSIINHTTQFIRLSFAVIMFCYLPNLLRTLNRDTTFEVLKKVMMFHVYIQIFYFIIYHIGFSSIFHTIENYEQRTALINENYLFFNHFILVNSVSGYLRFSGLFEEPAWYGWTIVLLLSFILQYQCRFKRNTISIKDSSLIIISFLFTFSVSAIISLFLICCAYLFFKYKQKAIKFIPLIALALILIGYTLFSFNESFQMRLESLAEGADGSSNSRLIGSWNALVTILNNNPLIGFGLGDINRENYFNSLSQSQMHGISIMGLTILDIHNMIVQVICSLGLIGCFLFLRMINGLNFKNSAIAILGLILTFFSVNVFNTYFYFAIIAIAISFFKCKTI